MPKNKTKLELTWIGKENRPKLEPRILIEDTEKYYHAAHRVSENDIFGNSLLAPKALEQEIKCIFIPHDAIIELQAMKCVRKHYDCEH